MIYLVDLFCGYIYVYIYKHYKCTYIYIFCKYIFALYMFYLLSKNTFHYISVYIYLLLFFIYKRYEVMSSQVCHQNYNLLKYQ